MVPFKIFAKNVNAAFCAGREKSIFKDSRICIAKFQHNDVQIVAPVVRLALATFSRNCNMNCVNSNHSRRQYLPTPP
jgi:hypothetical protein